MNRSPIYLAAMCLSVLLLATGCPQGGSSAGWYPVDETVSAQDSSGQDVLQDLGAGDRKEPEPDAGLDADVQGDVLPDVCWSDADCPGQRCEPNSHTCVQCLGDGDCPDGYQCSHWQCVQATGCSADVPCPEGLVCNDWGTCVECLSDEDCAAAPGGQCTYEICHYACGTGCPENMVCDPDQDLCVECFDDAQCLVSQWCNTKWWFCFEDVCFPGDVTCIDDVPATCASNGSGWVPSQPCPDATVCFQGECHEDLVCAPGTRICDGNTSLVCRPDGSGYQMIPCNDDEKCQNGTCVSICIPACQGKECGDDGCGGSCGTCQPAELCENGVCVPNVDPDCIIGERKCIGEETFVECNQDTLTWGPPKDCPDNSLCQWGYCSEIPPVCTPGDAYCSGNSVVYCLDNGAGWSNPMACPIGTACLGGQCIDDSPGTCAEVLACMEGIACQDSDMWGCFEPCMAASDPGALDWTKEIFYCVVETCGVWLPHTDCFVEMTEYGPCFEAVLQCTGGCLPQCVGAAGTVKQCGPDGCGGVCGVCPNGSTCNASGMCSTTCTPQCAGKDCGTDGCGGTCGTCPPGSSCVAGGICQQTCTPTCQGKVCGSDGCGGVCGLCEDSYACKAGQCVLSLSCAELKECYWGCAEGDEACNNQCWLSASPAARNQYLAIVQCLQVACGENASDQCIMQALYYGACQDVWNECDECTPECVGKQCGDNGCGGSCGSCPAGFVCNIYGYCNCAPQCTNKQCGSDGCGGSCGTCPTGSVCNWQGACVCLPKCENKECGPDGCGGSCGTCPSGYQCTSGFCQATSYCGDGWCDYNLGETCDSCPEDCGWCNPECGDGICDADYGEECYWCPEDCGDCPDECGDGFCSWNEDCNSCPWDCGPCPDQCGDGYCDSYYGETCSTCPTDCGTCGGYGCCDLHDEPGCSDPDVMSCTCQMDPYCCEQMWDNICVDEAQQYCGADCGCTPQCVTSDGQWKQCGDDGCGGVCGVCSAGYSCIGNQCIYNPASSCGDVLECMTGYKCDFDDPYQCFGPCLGDVTTPDSPMAIDYYYCVLDTCGQWLPGTECFVFAQIQACRDRYEACTGVCTPNCYGVQCGSDGCGGSCGTCQPGQACVNGLCSGGCVPQCTTADGTPKVCGPNGCGGQCGSCPPGTQCLVAQGICQQTCVPSCAGKQCGGDGCGGSCGTCNAGYTCSSTGHCIPGTTTTTCMDMVECSYSCNFELTCVLGCVQGGTQASNSAFQNLLLCVAQQCGYTGVTQACAENAMNGACLAQYTKCLQN